MIIDLQRKMSEAGRIRIGQQVATSNGKTRPAKLDTFRLTSPDQRRIREAAKLYGGTPQEWQAPAGPEWEVVTEADTLAVVVPPVDLAFTQWYETWSAGGCLRRCDGVTETISDGPCQCNPEHRECNIHTRLSVMLRDLRGLGLWRIDTSGYYAATELQGAVEVIHLAAGRGQMLPALLRLEQRLVKREGQTRRFAVPVLDIDISPAQLLSGPTAVDPLDAGTVSVEPPAARAITPVPDAVPQRPIPSIGEQATATKTSPKRKNAAQPIPSTGLAPRTVAQAAAVATAPEPVQTDLLEPPPDDDDEPRLITPPQLKKLAILLREAGFGDDNRDGRLAFCIAAIRRDITSSKELTVDEASKVIDILEEGKNRQ